MNIILTITEDEKKVLDSWLGVDKIQEWLQHALDNKIRQRVDASILEDTNLNPKKMSKVDKLIELAKIDLKRKEDRDGMI
jgi:hypothetical protein